MTAVSDGMRVTPCTDSQWADSFTPGLFFSEPLLKLKHVLANREQIQDISCRNRFQPLYYQTLGWYFNIFLENLEIAGILDQD